ncbi:MAG: RNB domain-containing ribonuclease, partial [Ramlibacter sp.]|nr:RNB domain-containing ribonuclease [Ramlibacter sp.]
MFAMFEESGKYLAGRILSQAEASSQIELDSGKRVKVKQAHIVLTFDKPTPAELLAQAQSLSADIDVQLLWEFAPEDEFSFREVACDYFQDPASTVEQAATLLAIFNAPHYFRRAGGPKGRFRKAPEEIVQQALLAIEKKRQIQLQIDAWAAELVAGSCPQPVREQLYRILFKPDKNGPEYKAVVQAARDAKLA